MTPLRSIIEIRNLSKVYQLGAIGATRLKDEVALLWDRVRGRHQQEKKGDFWALRDVSFNVQPGEVVGIIGRNGAGKSTLLKILSRITQQTAGEIVLRGRVASLLEVGTGFHPDLSGRDNVFLNGAILGMSRAEIRRKLDEIIAFAEVEQFIDTPVKRYSSGMYVRLAFAVAAHLEPEILIVDEVLAVGDAQFQKKCLGKMSGVASQGRTVLFVSHNMTALQTLCPRAVWLDKGRLIEDGTSSTVTGNYLASNKSTFTERIWDDPQTAPGDESVRLRRVAVVPETATLLEPVTVATPLRLEFEFWNRVDGAELNISMVLFTLQEVCVLNDASPVMKCPVSLVRWSCRIPAHFLNDGQYRVTVLVVKDASVALLNEADIIAFEVHDVERQGKWFGKWIGVVRPHFEWKSDMQPIASLPSFSAQTK